MARLIEMDGQPFAVLVESEANGNYLVPPVVFDEAGNLVEGVEVFMAAAASGVGVTLPVMRNVSPDRLAWIDQTMAMLSFHLQVPILPEES